MILRPSNIVFGGGVMNENFLIKIRQQFKLLLNDYVYVPRLDEYLRMPRIPDNGSATLGNLALAYRVNQA
ncbi:ROK family protein [Bombilactobacillus mellis]|uniref:ROK family protein n=1 Tax=Bombilactobacillus mellis TaxID=1218508 RepID=UPI0022482A14|nr:ROK family protein [Bombilactobacillus mellis]MCX0278985.1 ROK family protein [Bombilactobacillus mellis]